MNREAIAEAIEGMTDEEAEDYLQEAAEAALQNELRRRGMDGWY